MNMYEKGKLLKTTIEKLYVNEGRSKSYISRLLEIDRPTIRTLIKEWGFQQNNQTKRKIEEFLSMYKEFIIARIKDGWTYKQIYTHCKKGGAFFNDVIKYDSDIQETLKLRNTRTTIEYLEIPEEVWKPVLGYSNYEVSDYGRVRNTKGIIVPQINCISGYEYVSLTKDGKRHNLKIHRLVAFAFCSGYTEQKMQVNHIDGNIHNNKASNLEWVTPSENLKHSYDILKRPVNKGKVLSYTILYKDKYVFKTIASFARFLNKSETQTRRIMEKGIDIKLIPK